MKRVLYQTQMHSCLKLQMMLKMLTAIEARGIMEEHKKKLSEIKTLEETIQSMRTRAKELE